MRDNASKSIDSSVRPEHLKPRGARTPTPGASARSAAARETNSAEAPVLGPAPRHSASRARGQRLSSLEEPRHSQGCGRSRSPSRTELGVFASARLKPAMYAGPIPSRVAMQHRTHESSSRAVAISPFHTESRREERTRPAGVAPPRARHHLIQVLASCTWGEDDGAAVCRGGFASGIRRRGAGNHGSPRDLRIIATGPRRCHGKRARRPTRPPRRHLRDLAEESFKSSTAALRRGSARPGRLPSSPRRARDDPRGGRTTIRRCSM